jgi:hypothetical protein
MAKRFMFVCFGLLALAVAFHLGAQYGHAEYVDPSATGLVAALNAQGQFLALDGNGQLWRWLPGYRVWDRMPNGVLPVPVSQVKFLLDSNVFISVSNEAWQKENDPDPWVNFGPPPGMTATQPSTWGGIKAQFK